MWFERVGAPDRVTLYVVLEIEGATLRRRFVRNSEWNNRQDGSVASGAFPYKNARMIENEIAEIHEDKPQCKTVGRVPMEGYDGLVRVIYDGDEGLAQRQFYVRRANAADMHRHTHDIPWSAVRGITEITPQGKVRLYFPLTIHKKPWSPK